MKKLSVIYIGLILIYSCSLNNNVSVEKKIQNSYIFQDNVAVYSDIESIDKNKIASLSTGNQITIIKKTEISSIKAGFNEYWYKISYSEKNQNKIGYIWGGDISKLSIDLDDDLQLLFGIIKYSKDKNFEAKIKVLNKDRLLSSLTFLPLQSSFSGKWYSYDVEYKIEDSKGFKNIDKFIVIKFIYEACGYPNGDIWLAFDGKKMRYAFERVEVGESGAYYVEQKILFPRDKHGKKDTVIIVKKIYHYDEEKEDYKLSDKSEIIYAYDGQNFIKE